MTNLAQLLQISGGDRTEAAQWMESSIAILARHRLSRDARGQTLAKKRALLAELTEQSPAQPEGQAGELMQDQWVALVRQARNGDQELAEQLSPILEQLASNADAPPEIQALAHVLLQLLAGETSPDLSGLPPELVEAVREALDPVKP